MVGAKAGPGRVAALLLALGAGLGLTGCWDMTDINDRSPTVAVGFDRTPDGAYQVTLANALGTAASGQTPAGIAVGITPSGRGSTLAGALADLHRITARSVAFEAVQVYVLGSALVQHGDTRTVLKDLLDANDVDPSSILLASRDSAAHLLGHRDPVFQSEGIRLVREFRSTHAISDGGVAEPLWDAERSELAGLPFVVARYAVDADGLVRAVGALVVPPQGRAEILQPDEQDALVWMKGRNDYAQVDLPDGQVLRVLSVRLRRAWDRANRRAMLHLDLIMGGYRLDGFIRETDRADSLATEAAGVVAARVGALMQRLSAAGLDVLDLRELARQAGVPASGVAVEPMAFTVHVVVMPIPERQPGP